MFRNKGLGHKWLKKKRVSLVEKNVRITERFFDNHYNALRLMVEPVTAADVNHIMVIKELQSVEIRIFI